MKVLAEHEKEGDMDTVSDREALPVRESESVNEESVRCGVCEEEGEMETDRETVRDMENVVKLAEGV